MSPRYLFGPVTPAFADQNLHRALQKDEGTVYGSPSRAYV